MKDDLENQRCQAELFWAYQKILDETKIPLSLQEYALTITTGRGFGWMLAGVSRRPRVSKAPLIYTTLGVLETPNQAKDGVAEARARIGVALMSMADLVEHIE
jgi:hypothetical protein